MKRVSTLLMTAVLFTFGTLSQLAASEASVAIVDFRECAENSALGKQQQESFEGLKQQIQDVMDQKEKEIKGMAEKLQDPDFLDSLSPEAEGKMKQEFQQSNMAYNQMQQQFFQTLQQANVQIVRMIGESIQEHAQTIAKSKRIDLVLNAESCFYFNSPYDLTSEVISQMDSTFEKDAKEAGDRAE
jgi:outer membrane protein